MKKSILMSISLSILMLTLAVNVSATPIHILAPSINVPTTAFSVPAPGIEVQVIFVGVIKPECIRVFVIITDVNNEGTRYLVTYGQVDIGAGCDGQNVHSPPDSPVDLSEVIDKPEVQRALDDWYKDYMRNNPR